MILPLLWKTLKFLFQALNCKILFSHETETVTIKLRANFRKKFLDFSEEKEVFFLILCWSSCQDKRPDTSRVLSSNVRSSVLSFMIFFLQFFMINFLFWQELIFKGISPIFNFTNILWAVFVPIFFWQKITMPNCN